MLLPNFLASWCSHFESQLLVHNVLTSTNPELHSFAPCRRPHHSKPLSYSHRPPSVSILFRPVSILWAGFICAPPSISSSFRPLGLRKSVRDDHMVLRFGGALIHEKRLADKILHLGYRDICWRATICPIRPLWSLLDLCFLPLSSQWHPSTEKHSPNEIIGP